MATPKEKKEEIEWDRKRIIIFLIFGIILIGSALYVKNVYFGSSNPVKIATQKKQVKGISTIDIANGIRQSFQANINGLKNEAQNLNVAEIASSSPQVQKILNDLRNIKDVPKSQLKGVCEKVCSGL